MFHIMDVLKHLFAYFLGTIVTEVLYLSVSKVDGLDASDTDWLGA